MQFSAGIALAALPVSHFFTLDTQQTPFSSFENGVCLTSWGAPMALPFFCKTPHFLSPPILEKNH
jgi:hypothetical protein